MHSKVEAVACRTLKINIVFIAAVLVHVTKYIYGQHLYKRGRCMHSKVEAVACRTLKINIVFIAACVVHSYQIYLWVAPV